ncbi:AraC family transcriptional regulator [Leucobacter rhizosphaerae]|uniref:AraC family transcriptional regulator n=1 Tax=Leucobacter rhizosphaerae TaxID=2932245 RepID=A0ABY4FT50_9MICO|nr:AraC family transcriptional regulator [Leucobacter rhizosphaerae]UOQ59455.1 AraC family transcriptional regulator [Leucobacter rhizosphaerae]
MSGDTLERVGLSTQVHSLGAAHDLGVQLYYPHRLTPLGAEATLERFTLTAVAAALGPVTAGLLTYSTGIRIDTAPYETAYQCNVPLRGSLRTSVGEQRVQATRSRAAVYTPDVDTAISGWEHPCVMLAVKLDRGMVERRLAQEAGPDWELRFDPALDVASGAAKAWITSVRELIARVQRLSRIDPGLATFLAERCVDGFVASTLRLDAPAVHSRSANARIVAQALEAITYSSGAPLSLGSIAEYVGVSGRSVQAAFREIEGRSPMQAQRSDRLQRVHQDLLRAADGTRVHTIAQRHGFSHMGRFSAMYQRTFGELPSQTLDAVALSG